MLWWMGATFSGCGSWPPRSIADDSGAADEKIGDAGNLHEHNIVFFP